ncbi:MAG: methyltransferase domain-containing protein [Kiritimatiellae bacterium]|nr:methyltransferase domain-containing protein [Kiritimatiellia bacterium]MDD5522028.1 methyltransferase domain-containing protein [Kiritimatiellia bacterium]
MKKLCEKGGRRTRKRHAKIAAGTGSHAGRPDPVAYAKSLGYSEKELKTVPVDAVMSHGCGNPVALLELRPGEIVLDLGCGGGLDAFLAAQRVGPAGRVIGVDMTREMVKKANENAEKAGLENIEFKHAPIERLPLDNNSVDVAISNCVMNHCFDKVRAFKEVYRVLKPRGRMCISDLVTAGKFSEDVLKDKVWGEWLTVAQSKNDYLRAIEGAGFQEITVEGEATFPMAENDDRLKGRIVSIHVTARKQ